MTLTAAHVRQACDLLRWKASRLSQHARISYRVAVSARQDGMISTVSGTDLWAIRTSFEKAGVRFGIDANGQSNVVLSESEA